MEDFLMDLLRIRIHPLSEATQNSGRNSALRRVSAFQQLMKWIATSPLLVLYHQSTRSMKTGPCPLLGSLYTLVSMARALWTRVFVTTTGSTHIWARMYPPLADRAATSGRRNRFPTSFPFAQ